MATKAIVKCNSFYLISEKRQTMLFSATQTRKVEDLARLSLKKAPLYVGVDDDKDASTVEGLEQVWPCNLITNVKIILLHCWNTPMYFLQKTESFYL